MVDGDELGPVGKGRLDLHGVDHRGDALHAVLDADDMGAGLHQVGDAAAVAGAFDDRRADVGDRFGVIELEPATGAPWPSS